VSHFLALCDPYVFVTDCHMSNKPTKHYVSVTSTTLILQQKCAE